MPDRDWRAGLRGSGLGNVVVILITVVAIALAWFVIRPDPANDVTDVRLSEGAPKVGEQAPDFTTQSVTGEEVSLSGLSGRPVWLLFMATWCSGCRAEMPDVQKAHEVAGDDGVQVVVVFAGEGTDTVVPYSERLGLTMTRVTDAGSRLADAYGVSAMPVHFFLDADGVVRFVNVGSMSAARIEEALETVR